MSFSLIDRMRFEFGMTRSAISQLINSAPHRYKTYQIPKNSGKGFRVIAKPAREVKLIQRWILTNVLEKIEVSEVSVAYKKGIGIKFNAMLHKNNAYLVKFDFKDFFPSIVSSDFDLLAKQENQLLKYNSEELDCLKKLLFWQPGDGLELRLSIGAPTSPMLSNLMMRQFDEMINDRCKKDGIVFTRYADDMTFSMSEKEMRGQILGIVNGALSKIEFPKLRLNKNKTIFCSKAGRRMVTGIIITNNNEISLGRERKRLIRSMLHRRAFGMLEGEDATRLRGLLAFALDIEPEFVKTVFKKYPGLSIESIA